MVLDPILPAAELRTLTDAVIVDCRPDTAAYRAGHLAGARHAQLERDLAAVAADAAHGGRHPLPALADFAATLGRWGITPATHVVAYDDQQGANAASRLWWMLTAIGHAQVQIVDGALPALIAAGYALTADEPPVTAGPAYPIAIAAWPGVVDINEVARARTDPARRVIDVRAPFRYRGEREPFDPIAGHIPGAHNAPFADNLRADGTFKSADELRALFTTALDGTPPGQTIVHCGSGVTACHSLLALHRAGLTGAQLYIGSWSEWCRDPARPRAP